MPMITNPVWDSLHSEHARFATGSGALVRYPRAVAPFLAVARDNESLGHELDALVAPGETFYFVGCAPQLPASWPVERSMVLQMRCDAAMEPKPVRFAIVPLGTHDIGDMLALTAIAYPAFFRERAIELGRYLGVHVDGRLVAMAGERMRLTGWQEISGICTHPDHRGHGYARELTRPFVDASLARGVVPFLHVSVANTHAIGLYERWGFVRNGEFQMWKVSRPGEAS